MWSRVTCSISFSFPAFSKHCIPNTATHRFPMSAVISPHCVCHYLVSILLFRTSQHDFLTLPIGVLSFFFLIPRGTPCLFSAKLDSPVHCNHLFTHIVNFSHTIILCTYGLKICFFSSFYCHLKSSCTLQYLVEKKTI